MTLVLLLGACASAPPATRLDKEICSQANVSPWTLLGETRWSQNTQFGADFVGGLSSIDYDAQAQLYYLVSDDRSQRHAAHYYTARISYDEHRLKEVTLLERRPLQSPAPMPDAEALRRIPGTQRLLWSSEGDFAHGFGPQLIEADGEPGNQGQPLRQWPLPPGFELPQRPSATQGPRNNFTLEGMGFSEDGKTLWLSMEGALKQDGPMPGPGRVGAPVRITAYDAASQRPLRQLAYIPDALPADLWLLPHRAVNGVSDILVDGPDHLLVLERSFTVGGGFGARIYRISTTIADKRDSPDDAPNAATDTLNIPQLIAGQYRAAAKTLVLDLADAGLKSVDNLEGMSWGPPLASGEQVLLLVSDNNFNPAEVTQFIALKRGLRLCAAGL